MANNLTLNLLDYNVTGNDTGNAQTVFNPSGVIFLCVLYVLIFIIGPICNGFVIYIIAFRHKQRNAGDIFVVYLASIDFLFSLFVPISYIPDIITQYQRWYYGKIFCKIFPIIPPLATFASSWVLVAIAIDRHR